MFVSRKKYDEAMVGWQGAINSGKASLNNFQALKGVLDANERELSWARSELDVANAKVAEAQGRLARIVASETPHMAWVGKRAVLIAQGKR